MRTRLRLAAVWLLILGTSFSLAGCFKPDRDTLSGVRTEEHKRQMLAPEESGGEMMKRVSKRSRLSDEQRTRVVAKVAGRDITTGELEMRLNGLPDHVRLGFGSPDRMRDFLNHIVDLETMYAEARSEDLVSRPAVQTAIKLAMARAFLHDAVGEAIPVPAVTDEEVRAEYDLLRSADGGVDAPAVGSFEEEAQAIRNRLYQERQGEAISAWLAELRAGADVVIHEDVLATLKAPAPKPKPRASDAAPVGDAPADAAAASKKERAKTLRLQRPGVSLGPIRGTHRPPSMPTQDDERHKKLVPDLMGDRLHPNRTPAH